MQYRVLGFLVACLTPLVALSLGLGSADLLWQTYYTLFEYDYTWYEPLETIRWLLVRAGIVAVPLVAGWWFARGAKLPATWSARLWPLCLPLIWLLLLSAYIHAEFPLLMEDWLAPTKALALIYLLFFASFIIIARRRARTEGGAVGNVVLATAFTMALGLCAGSIYNVVSNTFYYDDDDDYVSVGHGVSEYYYIPFHSESRLAKLDSPASLSISSDYPRLDGAIALLPVYGAAVQATYKNINSAYAGTFDSSETRLWDVMSCTNTPSAWQRLIDGEIDIFFGAPPSKAQLASLEEAGLTPEIIPVLNEAFVFMVHKDNPVLDVSSQSIRDIYTKRVTNWSELGGPDARILPFQRPEGSGSQSTMQDTVMAGETMASPLREERMVGMGDIVNAVADYRNYSNSLGYSFRWYATEQFPSDAIRFLAVDGVEPVEENIKNGSYLYTVPFVMVTCRPKDENTAKLIEWMLGPEGQALIAKTGYVPLD